MLIDLDSLSLLELLKLKVVLDWHLFKRLWWLAATIAAVTLAGWLVNKRKRVK